MGREHTVHTVNTSTYVETSCQGLTPMELRALDKDF